jgi:multiple sugar transport system substrate-binding protein
MRVSEFGSLLTRRSFLKAAGGGALAAAFLAACTPQAAAPAATGGESAAADAPVELDFFAWGDSSDIPAWEQLAADYQALHPNVTVMPTPTPGADYYPKLQTLFAGGTPPHIASFQGWEWQPYADQGLLAAIDDLVTRDGLTGPFPSDVQSVEVSTRRNGTLYLMPLQAATMVMFYAKQHFDEAGIDYPTDDWTLEDFLEIAQQLTRTEGDVRRFGYESSGIWPRDIHWIRSTGVQEFDELVDPKTAMFDQPEIIEIVQVFAQDVYHNLKISPTPADLEGGSNTIQTGNCAMKYEGAWFFPQLNSPQLREEGNHVPFDVVMMPQMADESRPHRGWSEGVTIPATDQVEAAWGFVSYMGGEEGQKTYSTITGRIPNDPALVESFWIPTIAERFEVQNGQAFLEAFRLSEVDVIGGVSRTQMWNEVVKPQGWDRMINNSATAAEVLPEVTAGVQALLDDYWSRQG